eukprot:CAMPEP_0181478554 /NCGR_PEP_ID=MMETSP1110-20121109/42808_1 /TAXON_ID=174948 /ORGANISM="Symbiodinium sp., Strain CCMP421" /LENGTH=248 /DNA_ID=CAMNT_0023603923 /DNA_START=62 /DNA_END=805 /DNA_ORIENTATION=+
MPRERGRDGFDFSFISNRDDSLGFIAEEDRVNCPFYLKIGACRNGDRCNRAHMKPTSGNTILIPHMYPCIPEAMAVANDDEWDDETYARQQEHLESFYEEVFLELAKFGEIEDMVVVDNVSEHMLGNVYCKYFNDNDADKAAQQMDKRFYGSRLIAVEYSPVTDFREARCRAFHETRCARGGLCNFMHIKHIPKAVKRNIVRQMYEAHPDYAGARAALAGAPAKKRKVHHGPIKRQTMEERRTMIAEW